MANGGGWGDSIGTGAKIIHRETENTELKADLIGSIAIGIALDVFVFLGLLLVVVLGEFSIAPILAVFVVCAMYLILWFFGVPKYFTIAQRLPTLKTLWYPLRWKRYVFASSKAITAKLLFVLSIVLGLVFGEKLWFLLTGSGSLKTLIFEFFYPIKFIPYWIASGFLIVIFIVKQRWQAGVTIWVVGSFVMFITTALLSDEAAQAWMVFAPMARYLTIPFILPWFPVIILFVAVTGKNRLFPYLDYTFKPLSLAEAREVGLFGLWLPKLLGGPPKSPLPEQNIRIDVEERGGKSHKYGNVGKSPELVAFCKFVLNGGSFAVRGAKSCGFSRTKFEKLRDMFIDRGWAVWSDEKNHEQGIDLLSVGYFILEDIVGEQKALPYPDLY